MIRFPFSARNRGAEGAQEAAEADAPRSRPAADDAAPGETLRSRPMLRPGSAPEPDLPTAIEPDPPAAAGAPSLEEQTRMVEAMLFASEKPLSTAELASRMPMGSDAAVAVRRLEEMYAGRGVQMARVAGKWAFRTAPDLAHLLQSEVVEQRKLSKAAIETLAIIAYHQPVTRAEIEEIRQVGVSKGTVDLLMEIGWIKLGRRRQTPGRPVTFVTTEKFLEYFGLDNLKDLPRLEELRQAGLFESRPPVGFEPSEDQLAARREQEAEILAEEEEDGASGKDADLLI